MKNILKIYNLIGIWLVINLILSFAIHKDYESKIISIKKYNDNYIIAYNYKLVYLKENNDIIWEQSFTDNIKYIQLFENNIYVLSANHITIFSLYGKEKGNIILNDYYDMFTLTNTYYIFIKNQTKELKLFNKNILDRSIYTYSINDINTISSSIKNNVYFSDTSNIYKLYDFNIDTIIKTHKHLSFFTIKNDSIFLLLDNELYLFSENNLTNTNIKMDRAFIYDNDSIIFFNKQIKTIKLK